MEKRQKLTLARLILAGVLLAAAVLASHFGWLPEEYDPWITLAAFLVPYLIAGGNVIWNAVKNILNGEVFDECFLMTLASVIALILGDHAEAAVVMLLYGIGEWFQDLAVDRSRASITALMDIRPDEANLEAESGYRVVSPEDVAVGQIILVKPGERVPLDGVIVDGTSTLDTAALTGEAAPRYVTSGSELFSGCINLTGTLRVRVTRPYGESAAVRILELVDHAAEKKAKAENFITRFSKIYTPAVVIAAVLLAVIPPLLLHGEWNDWIHRALTFLVISCPCALVISVPLTYYGGIGGASKHGILVKGSCYLDALANASTVVMDKTGTLTEGIFAVQDVYSDTVSSNELLLLAECAERYSDHPVAQSIRAAAPRNGRYPEERIRAGQEYAGRGASVTLDGRTLTIGSAQLMRDLGMKPCKTAETGSAVYVARDGEILGYLIVADTVKAHSPDAISALGELGIKNTVMLTGDSKAAAKQVAEKLGIRKFTAELLPDGKAAELERLLKKQHFGKRLIFVGDGINDAPSLALADVGIAMGALGSDAAIEAADVVLADDDPRKIASVIRIARHTRRIARENIALCLFIKTAVLILGALGFAGMWAAVFADVGVCILAALNALRAMWVSE